MRCRKPVHVQPGGTIKGELAMGRLALLAEFGCHIGPLIANHTTVRFDFIKVNGCRTAGYKSAYTKEQLEMLVFPHANWAEDYAAGLVERAGAVRSNR
jgi:hypothetical protein